MFVLLSDNAKLPLRATKGSGCFDLYSTITCTIQPNETKLIPTGLQLEKNALKTSQFLAIMSRSGLALKYSVIVLNAPGIVDADYPGEIGVVLHNLGSQPFEVTSETRVAQATVLNYCLNDMTRYSSRETRIGGFGSTGGATHD